MSNTPDTAWIITGPTSGMGRVAALELARHGTVVLVGRSPDKLKDVETEIRALPGGGGDNSAVSVVCDFADIHSVQRAAAEIAALGLPLAGLANNAGIMVSDTGRRSAQGWDLTFATNHLGPFALTEALIPHLPDGANVVFTCSGAEDPDRRIATMAGFRGGRYLSAEASARGQWAPGGSTRPGFDAYATSKQANLATVFAFARQYPRLHLRAVEPGVNPGTNLGDAGPVLRFLAQRVFSPLAPLVKYGSTPTLSGKLIATVLTDPSAATGTYCDEKGRPMRASRQVSDPAFSDRLVAETRDLLATVPARSS